MKLQFLPANAAWAFTLGDQLITIKDRTIFETRKEAVLAAQQRGMTVDSKGNVAVTDEAQKLVNQITRSELRVPCTPLELRKGILRLLAMMSKREVLTKIEWTEEKFEEILNLEPQ